MSMEDHPKKIIFLLFLAAVTLNVVSITSWNFSYIANDGIQYLSTAGNWLAGNGFSTNTLTYAPHFQGKFPAAQTVWPNGYPFAIALLIKSGMDAPVAVLTLNHAAHALASLVMWLLLQKMGITRLFASVCTLVFYSTCMPWAYVSGGMTEPVFTTLLLAALLFLPRPGHSTLPAWLLCGLIIAACIYVRFSTVFFAASTGAGIMLYLLMVERRKPSALIKPCFMLALLVSLPALAFGHLMYRTHTLIGTFDRYQGERVPESLVSTLRQWAVAASEMLGFSASSLISSELTTALFVIFVLLATVIVLWFLMTRAGFSVGASADKSVIHFRVTGLVASLHALLMMVYLSYASMTSSPLEIISRYTYQVYPGLFAVFCVMFHTLLTRYASRNTPSFAPAHTALKTVAASLVALYLFAQINSSVVTRTHYFFFAKATDGLMAQQVSENIALESFIKGCFENNSQLKSIWSTHGQPVHLHTGIPTLTHLDIYTRRAFSANELADRMSEYNVGMFIFIEPLNFYDTQYNNYMSSVKEWITGEGFVKLRMLDNSFAKTGTVDIYAPPECSA